MYPTLICNYYFVLNDEDGGSVSHPTTNIFSESLDAGSTNRDGIVSLSFIIHLDTHQPLGWQHKFQPCALLKIY